MQGSRSRQSKYYQKARACDIFGKPINLRFEGKPNYNTLPGALCSLLFVVVIVLFALQKFALMVNRANSQITT